MDWLEDSQWLWWLGVALAAGVVEVATVDFVFLMIVGGSLIASISAAAGLAFPIQVIAFAVATILLLVTVRPPLRQWAHRTPHTAMGPGALVGQAARVLEAVSSRDGRIKLGGETWSARAAGDHETFEIGSTVYVVRIEGATAVVATSPLAGDPPSLEGRPSS
jgi:membrane protein implicated in regulation of membrane protease activity